MIHQAFASIASSDKDSILPHVITSTGNPIPIKLNVDSATMALLMFITTINMIEETKFGVKCRHNI